MKLSNINVFFILAALVFLPALNASGNSYPQPDDGKVPITPESVDLTVRCIVTYNVSVPGNTDQVRLIALIPESIPNKQKIRRINYSIEPDKFFKRNGNRYGQFTINNPGRYEKLEMTVLAELYRYDLDTVMKDKNKIELKDTGFAAFIRDERYIEKNNSQIRSIAKAIDGRNEIETIKEIYNYVIDNLEYSLMGELDRGALTALLTKKGDCTEYADLFVALCRAKKIPARVITGFSVQSDSNLAKHNWAEVYLHDYGWVPFDPSKGDIKDQVLRRKAFSKLKPTYIYYSDLRNDDILKNYHFCSFEFQGDPVSVTDTVEFEFPDTSR